MLSDSRMQHGGGGRLRNLPAQCFRERVKLRPAHAERESRLRAELPHAQRHRFRHALRHARAPRFERARQHEHRIDAPHFSKQRNRHRTRRRRVKKHAAASERSCESNGARQRMPHESEPDRR